MIPENASVSSVPARSKPQPFEQESNVEAGMRQELYPMGQSEERIPPEDFTEFNKEQFMWIGALLGNYFLMRWTGQMDWDSSFKSHDTEHHHEHLNLLVNLIQWSISMFLMFHAAQLHNVGLLSWMQNNLQDVRLPILIAVLYQLEEHGKAAAYVHLPTKIFELGYQSRLLGMAFVSQKILKRTHTRQQWLSLAGVTIMCSIMLWTEAIFFQGDSPHHQFLWGIVAVVFIVVCNVTASVLWEKALHNAKDQTTMDSEVYLWVIVTMYFSVGFVSSVFQTFVFQDSDNGVGGSAELGFFYGFQIWTWLFILSSAASGFLVIKTIQSSSCVTEFLASRLRVVMGNVVDISSSSSITARFLVKTFAAAVAEFFFVYAYGVPRHKWPILKGDGEVQYRQPLNEAY